jgi:hypothetical protein
MLERAALSPAMARMVWEGIERTAIRAVLPMIHVPTLVVDTGGVIPGPGCTELARRIPGARLVRLEPRDHLPIAGDVTDTASEGEAMNRRSRVRVIKKGLQAGLF